MFRRDLITSLHILSINLSLSPSSSKYSPQHSVLKHLQYVSYVLRWTCETTCHTHTALQGTLCFCLYIDLHLQCLISSSTNIILLNFHIMLLATIQWCFVFLQGQGDEDRVPYQPPVCEQTRHSEHFLLPSGQFLQLHLSIVRQGSSVLLSDVIQHFQAFLWFSFCCKPSWRFRKCSVE